MRIPCFFPTLGWKSSQKLLLESMEHDFSGSNKTSENCSPIFPDWIFQMRIRVPFCCIHLWDQIQAFETCFSVEGTDLLHIGLTQYQNGILPLLNGKQHGCPFGSWRSQDGYPLSESWPVSKGSNEHLGLAVAKFQKDWPRMKRFA